MANRSLSRLQVSIEQIQSGYKIPSPKHMVWENMSLQKEYKLNTVNSCEIDQAKQITFEDQTDYQERNQKKSSNSFRKTKTIPQEANIQHLSNSQSEASIKTVNLNKKVQISSNPFTKTKQLFKNKNNSLIFDDLTKENLFSIQKYDDYQHQHVDTECIFEFNSFGKSSNQFDKRDSENTQKYWNSSSIQMNFCKLKPQQFSVYQHNQDPDSHFGSNVKQFCFSLNDPITNDKLSDVFPQQITPKKAKAQIKSKNADTKSAIKRVIYDFIDNLDSIPSECITTELIDQTQSILNQAVRTINQTERNAPKQLFYCQTKRSSDKYIKGKQNTSREKFKVYETKRQKIGKSKQKDTTICVKAKIDQLKPVKNPKRFKF